MSESGRVFYALVRRDGSGMVYWKTGPKGEWTANVGEARRYGKRTSAAQARKHLLKRRPIDPLTFRVERAIEA